MTIASHLLEYCISICRDDCTSISVIHVTQRKIPFVVWFCHENGIVLL